MKALGLKWISLVVLGTALSFAGCGESSTSGADGTGGADGSAGATVNFSGIA